MTPLVGFRANRKMDQQGTVLAVRPPAIATASASEVVVEPSRVADYAYRIAAVTAGLFLLATVM